MAKLTPQQRNGLEPQQFALPGRKYPINDASHARNALSRAAANATPAQQATIKRKVRSKFPTIGVGPKRFGDGGLVEGLKKAVGMAPKKSMLEEELEKIKKRDEAAAQAKPAAPTAQAPKEDTTKRRKQIDDAVTAAGG